MGNKFREVEVVKHGSEGYSPKNKDLCPYKGGNYCESGSGGSLCGSNNGIKKVDDKEYVLCSSMIKYKLKK